MSETKHSPLPVWGNAVLAEVERDLALAGWSRSAIKELGVFVNSHSRLQSERDEAVRLLQEAFQYVPCGCDGPCTCLDGAIDAFLSRISAPQTVTMKEDAEALAGKPSQSQTEAAATAEEGKSEGESAGAASSSVSPFSFAPFKPPFRYDGATQELIDSQSLLVANLAPADCNISKQEAIGHHVAELMNKSAIQDEAAAVAGKTDGSQLNAGAAQKEGKA